MPRSSSTITIRSVLATGGHLLEDPGITLSDGSRFVGGVGSRIDAPGTVWVGNEPGEARGEVANEVRFRPAVRERMGEGATGGLEDRVRTARNVNQRQERPAAHQRRVDFRRGVMRLVGAD